MGRSLFALVLLITRISQENRTVTVSLQNQFTRAAHARATIKRSQFHIHVHELQRGHKVTRCFGAAAGWCALRCLCARMLHAAPVSPTVVDSARHNKCHRCTAPTYVRLQCVLASVCMLCFTELCGCYKQCEWYSRMTHTATEWDNAQ